MSSKKRRKKKGRAVEQASQVLIGCEVGAQTIGHSEKCVAEGGEGKEGVAGHKVSGDSGVCADGDNLKQPIANLESCNKNQSNSRRTTLQETDHQTSICEPPSSPSQSLPTKSSFEQELEWCIAQLELGMLRTGASKSQKQQNQKSIQTLQGSKTPLPRKRQVMRSLFGDYRSKMKTQPIPETHTAKEVKLEAAKTQEIETVGTYYRHCTRQSGKLMREEGQTQEGGFKFNFAV